MKKFLAYYTGVLVRPKQTFALLLQDEHRLRYGFSAVALNALLYTLVYVFLTMGGGAPSSFTPWLSIPREVYYSYDQFMLAPSMMLAWIAAAGAGQLLSRLFSGKGSYEETLAVFGFGICIACLASLVHDLPDSFLGAVGVLNLKEYEVVLNSPTIWRRILLTLYSIYFIWFGYLFVMGIAAAQKIRKSSAILVGLVSFCVYQTLFLVFNR